MQMNGTFDVKLGKSFLDPSSANYLTMRYDFMPASVDRSQPGSIKMDEGKEVVVNLPNVGSFGTESTVFRGSARPVQKECVLIYDKRTGELTLERITHAVQLKKTREEQRSSQPLTSVVPSGDSQSETARQQSSCDPNRKATTSSLSKRKPVDSIPTARQPVAASKPRTLSSSSSSSSTSSSGDSDSDDGREDRARDGDGGSSDSQTDGEINSDSSSLSDISNRSGNKASRVTANNAHNSTTYLPAHRKLIEHDLKLSDSDSDDGS